MKNSMAHLAHGAHTVIGAEELEKKISSGKKLVVKLGADPTAPDLHLGHAVVLIKLRQFQDLGHEIAFLIGDFTAKIGDPSGKSKTRPPLSDEEIQKNTRTYLEQVGKILDPKKLTIVFNSHWLSKLTGSEWLALFGKVTLARIIEREDFATRIAAQQPVGFHELVYPLLQGYDSVHLKADVELGGTDQTFNLLMGRFLQEQFGQSPQTVITMPLLVGLDGTAKMSKSLDNAIGLLEDPSNAYGKLMSLPDTLTAQYALLLLQKDISGSTRHPMELKKEMAYGIIEKFWGKSAANTAQAHFEQLFQKRDTSAVQEFSIAPQELTLIDLVKTLGCAESSGEARRLIEAGGLSVDNEKKTDPREKITPRDGMIIKAGKHRFFKLRLAP